MSEDGAWLTYLERDALAYGAGPIPHEHERLPVIPAQVDEIRQRQHAGLINPGVDPRLARLLGFAVARYPRLLPQITRMTTGLAPEDPEFIDAWKEFLRELGELLHPDVHPPAPNLTRARVCLHDNNQHHRRNDDDDE